MLFCSEVFLFLFLPLTLILYYGLYFLGRRVQNTVLLIASIVFYGYGEPRFVFIMLGSVLLNYIVGILISQSNKPSYKKLFLVIGVVTNILLLFIYKYLDFAVSNVNSLFGISLPLFKIALPIGISFFTFQAMSYTIDVYRGTEKVQKNLFDLALYIVFFPQLIAGPIVRYETIANQIQHRTISLEKFFDGTKRFIVGLFKKVMIANTLALISDNGFGLASSELSTSFAWLSAIAYSLMIYYDFSGYSDMAIGLSKMFGFEFLENFNYPYISKSITEFWRRWHISMGTWFRDYVYFPLGGSRVKSKLRLIFNLFVVWLATGVWHGANWTFIVWGLFFFVLLIIEKNFKFMNYIPGFIRYLFTMTLVVCGWVLFRSDTIGDAIIFLGKMFTASGIHSGLTTLNLHEHGLGLLCALVGMTPYPLAIIRKMKIPQPVYTVIYMAVFVLSAVYIIKGGYNVFIYFNF